MFRALTIFGWLGLLSVTGRTAEPPTLPGVGATMQEAVAAGEVAGVVTLVTTPAATIHWQATGCARLLPEVPMRRDAVFFLASITKVFTGVAVLMLQDEGRLDVNDPVAKYLPEFADLKTDAGEPAQITVAHLLTHMSGLVDVERTVYGRVVDLRQLLAAQVPLAATTVLPGRRWSYNSFAFDVAGRIVEVVSGQTFDAFLEDRLLGPLGMRDTTFYPDAAQQRRLAGFYEKNRHTGALELRATWSGLPLPVRGRFPPLPGGGLFSTAEDLARFCRLLLQRGELDGRRYLSERAFQLLTTIQTGDEPAGSRGWGFGAGVIRGPGDGLAGEVSPGSFGHSGASGCLLIVDPVRQRGYVLLVHRRGLPGGWNNPVAERFVESANHALALVQESRGALEGPTK